jgi:hypothetical protein
VPAQPSALPDADDPLDTPGLGARRHDIVDLPASLASIVGLALVLTLAGFAGFAARQ